MSYCAYHHSVTKHAIESLFVWSSCGFRYGGNWFKILTKSAAVYLHQRLVSVLWVCGCKMGAVNLKLSTVLRTAES